MFSSLPSSLPWGKSKFLEEFRACQPCPLWYKGDILPLECYTNKHELIQEEEQNGYLMYIHAYNAELGSIILGRVPNKVYAMMGLQRKGREEIGGIMLGCEEYINFSAQDPTKVIGTLLPMAQQKTYSYKVNDAFILGGVHACLPFYIASPITEENILCSKKGITTYARELLGLLHFGYKRYKHDKLGDVFLCKDRDKAKNATLKEYEIIIKEYTELGKSSDPRDKAKLINVFMM
eukprot:TRINITY_DN123450_c0_g1_i1.p1 TRINITY_DN123450_c0_g1~~TRINITY_DN123450_c0_g1_i1.p1  ORF type:complete len:268 (-),score=22.89 TRINITY_DN123450_c0_g1_i1:148-852(-)